MELESVFASTLIWIFCQISPRSVTVIRGDSATFDVTLNIPFGCKVSPCRLDFDLYDQNDDYTCGDSSIAFVRPNTCGGSLYAEEDETGLYPWSGITKHANVATKNSQRYGAKTSYTMAMLFRTESSNAKPFWELFKTDFIVSKTIIFMLQFDLVSKMIYTYFET